MDILDDLTRADLEQETILTIGAFDGVHRGHQALIRAVVERAHATDRLAALITFLPHPGVVLAPDRAPRSLTTPAEKMALLESLGVDVVVMLPFNRQVAATPARDFMEKIAAHLRLRELWIGEDFALGRNREGNVSLLREIGQDLGYEVHVFEPILDAEEIVSSSRIRSLLAEGRVEEVSGLLGRPPSLSGEVVLGAQRGRKLGFPTANLQVRSEQALPANGVYAVFAVLGSERFPAVANIGVRPSFDNGLRTVETHILGFDRDIYGCDLVVEFVTRLRDERRFEDIDELVAQIEQDSQTAWRVLGSQLQSAGAERTPDAPCRFRYREVEHTADRALRVWGYELEDLFAGAAKGMYSLMADLDGLVATDWREIRLEAWDPPSLLVDWLNELLFLTEMEGLVFVDSRIESLEETVLVARAGGIAAPISKAQIKAATFHDLEFVRDGPGWSTVITLDV